MSALALVACYPDRYHISGEFARKLEKASGVEVLDWYSASILNLNASESKGLVRAILNAKGEQKGMAASTAPMCELKFFQGTNLVARIAVQEDWFAADGGEFVDRSDVLKTLQRRVESNRAGHRAWCDRLVNDIVPKPELANLQTWSMESLRRYEAGSLRTVGARGENEIDYRDLPDWLEKAVRAYELPPMPAVCVGLNAAGHAEAILIKWPKYGLVVGSSNYQASFRARYITNGPAGIFAYHE